MPRMVIISPVLSEKANNLMLDKDNRPTGVYVFKVAKDATKMEIKNEIERLYNVKVESVNTMIVPGKKRLLRGRVGRTSAWKKAIVKLAKGTIPIFEEVVEQQPKEEKPKKEEKVNEKKVEKKPEKAKKEEKKAKKEDKK
jgi:large subunit ribosomal protein L23